MLIMINRYINSIKIMRNKIKFLKIIIMKNVNLNKKMNKKK